jgi:hypothetical protein
MRVIHRVHDKLTTRSRQKIAAGGSASILSATRSRLDHDCCRERVANESYACREPGGSPAYYSHSADKTEKSIGTIWSNTSHVYSALDVGFVFFLIRINYFSTQLWYFGASLMNLEEMCIFSFAKSIIYIEKLQIAFNCVF